MAGYTTLPTLQPSLGCGGGPVPLLKFWENYSGRPSGLFETYGDGHVSIGMFNIPLALSFKNPQLVFQGTETGLIGAIDDPHTLVASLGLYTKTGNTFTLVNSASMLSEGVVDDLPVYFRFDSTSNTLIPAGNYWLAVNISISTLATSGVNTFSVMYNKTFSDITENNPFVLYGTSTATRSDIPASFVSSDIDCTTAGSWRFPYILITG